MKPQSLQRAIALRVSLLIVVVSFGTLITFLALSRTRSAVIELATDAPARTRAAFEMETNAISTGSEVLDYVETGDPRHRTRVRDAAADFSRFHAQYVDLVGDDQQRRYADQVGAAYGQLLEHGEFVMNHHDEKDDLYSSVSMAFAEIEQTIDHRIAADHATGAQLDHLGVVELRTLEAEAAEVHARLGLYLASGLPAYQEAMQESTSDFRAHLARYRNTHSSIDGASFADKVVSEFDRYLALAEQIVSVDQSIKAETQDLIALRTDLVELLDEATQPGADADYVSAQALALETSRQAGFSILATYTLCLVAAGLIAWHTAQSLRSILRELMASAEAIASGNFEYRVPLSGWSELLDLADKFSHMTAFLRSSVASQASLEARERRLQDMNIALVEEVIERRRAENAARLSESHLQTIIDHQPSLMMILGIGGTIRYANPSLQRALGLSQEELAGWNVAELVHPNERRRISDLTLDCPETPRTEDSVLCRMLHKDGSWRWLLGALTRIPDFRGETAHIAAFVDITDRLRAEEGLQRTVRQLSTLSRIGSAVVSGLDLDRALLRVVDETHDLLQPENVFVALKEDGGLRLAAASGSRAADLRDRRISDAAGTLAQLLRNGEPVFASGAGEVGPMLETFRKDFEVQAGSFAAAPLRAAGSILGMIVLTDSQPAAFDGETLQTLESVAGWAAIATANARQYSDLQESLRRERVGRDQLIQAEKLAALGRMLSSVAHELNNPLQAIRNCLFLVEPDVAEAAAEARGFMRMAIGEIERLIELVGSLRATYRPSQEASVSRVELGRLVNEVRSLTEAHLQEHDVMWVSRQPAEELVVLGVEPHLRQILLNLCLNAIEAMQPDGGTITVTMLRSPGGQEVGVSVHDTGPGIDPSHLPHVFEPFFTTKEQGAGLGLSVSYEIARRHGGRIEADSQPGAGATLTLWLPLAPLEGMKTDGPPEASA